MTIVSPLNLPASMGEHSSMLYARNVQSLLELLVGEDGELHLNFDDEIIAGACITRDGEIVHPGAKKTVEGQTPTVAEAAPKAEPEAEAGPEAEDAPDDAPADDDEEATG